MTISEKDSAYVWHPFSPLKGGWENLPVLSAKDCTLHLEDGREILDAISSWWVTVHGHSNERMAKAIYDQATTLEHVIFAAFIAAVDSLISIRHLLASAISLLLSRGSELFSSSSSSRSLMVI